MIKNIIKISIFFIIINIIVLNNILIAKDDMPKNKISIYGEIFYSSPVSGENELVLEKYKVVDKEQKFSAASGYGMSGRLEYNILNWISINITYRNLGIKPLINNDEIKNEIDESVMKVISFEGDVNEYFLNTNFETIVSKENLISHYVYIGGGIGYFIPRLRYLGYIESGNISELYTFDISPNVGFNINCGYKLNYKYIIGYVELAYTKTRVKVNKISYEVYNNGTKETGEFTGDKLTQYKLDSLNLDGFIMSIGIGIRI